MEQQRAQRDLFGPAFVRPLTLLVDPTEVGHDDRDGKGDDQDPAQGAHAPHHPAEDRLRDHVSVPREPLRQQSMDG